MPLPQAISLLVRCAGGGGNLALGVGPKGDGSFLPDHAKRLREMGDWLRQYGESVYGTQGGPYIPGIWGASTYKENTVYLHVLASWNGVLALPSLPAKIQSMEVLSGGTAKIFQTSEHLVVEMDPEQADPIDTLIKLVLDRPASEIVPIPTLPGTPVSIGATATASSERTPENGAQNIVAANATEFSEGIHVKKPWGPASDDSRPWLQLTLENPATVSGIKLRESSFGSPSRIQEFTIEAKLSSGWKTIHTGTAIGADLNILLEQPVVSDTFRLHILKWDHYLDLDSIQLYE
jgi:alpha-L-fucosidase